VNIIQHCIIRLELSNGCSYKLFLFAISVLTAVNFIRKMQLIYLRINFLKHGDYFTYDQVEHKKFCMVLALLLCVLYGSHNRQRLLPYKILADWFCITEMGSVYCAVRTESYKIDIFRL